MSNVSGRKIALVRMHTTTHVQGIGNLGPILDKNSKGNLQMTMSEVGILVKGRLLPNPLVEFIVPYATVQSIELVPEE